MVLLNKISAFKASLYSFKVCSRSTNLSTNFPVEVILGSKFLSTSSTLNSRTSNVKKTVREKIEAAEDFSKKFVKFVTEESRKLYDEAKSNYYLNSKPFQIRDPSHTIDMLYTFENEEILKNFVVTTDSTHDVGYSSASLEVTQNGTLMFSGIISNVKPKTGNVITTGYANFSSKRKMKPFFRKGYYDWREYTNLVLKVRGEGRQYLIILSTPYDYEDTKNWHFVHPFHTRGGPYWQITKIPFSHFAFGSGGTLNDSQCCTVRLNKISKFGISVKDGIDGPFKLEVDYIGLEEDPTQRDISPYEEYYVGKNYL